MQYFVTIYHVTARVCRPPKVVCTLLKGQTIRMADESCYTYITIQVGSTRGSGRLIIQETPPPPQKKK